MGHLISKIESISIQHFESVGTRPRKVSRVIRVPNSRTLIFENEKGQLFTNDMTLPKRVACLASAGGWEMGIIDTLVKLGRVTQEERDQHYEFYKQRSKERSAKYAANSIKEAAEEYGLELTAEQKKFIEDNPL